MGGGGKAFGGMSVGREAVDFLFLFFRTRRIGANPKNSSLVNFRGPD